MAKRQITMIVRDLTKVQGTSVPLLITLLDNNLPLQNKEVYITINGVTYTRTTNDAGIAQLNINLGKGEYPTTVKSFTDSTYSQTVKTITVKVTDKKIPTIIAENFTKVHSTKPPLEVGLFDNNVALIDKPVDIEINGVTYRKKTNNQGIATLNINLGVGVYYTSITTVEDDTYQSITKDIVVTILDKKNIVLLVNDLTKTYGETKQLRATLYYQTTPLRDKEVYFTINGVTYTRKTNNNGEAQLNINLIPGEYGTTVKTFTDDDFNSTTKNVTVIVKKDTKIEGRDISKRYLETGAYTCKLLDVYGNALPNQDLQLTINGVTYNRKTDDAGNVSLNIRLNPKVYTIIVNYKGDRLNNPTTTSNTVTVRKDIEEVTVANENGTTEPSNNRGVMQTHIYHLTNAYDYLSEEAKKYDGNIHTYFLPNWENAVKNNWEIAFTSYEINETDPRVKTAKVTTPVYFDLTQGQRWLCITNPNFENFAGQILKVDYDDTTGLYTYQCQDGRRQYQNKKRGVYDNSARIYEVLQALLLSPARTYGKGASPDIDKLKANNQKLVSGLRPLKEYNLKISPVAKAQNSFEKNCPEILSYDSDMDKIMALAHYNDTPTDVWFDTSGVCHIDPIDLDIWLNTGIKFVHQDLASYKKGFDITNILTGITIKNPSDTLSSNKFNEWHDLRLFFGANIGLVDPVTITTQNTDSSSSTGSNDPSGIMSGKKTFAVGTDNISGYSSDIARVNKVVDALKAKGHNAYSIGVGDSVNQNHGLSSSRKGVINIFIAGGICAGTVKDYMDGFNRGYYHYDRMIMMFADCTTDNWISCNALRTKKQIRAWDDGFSSGIDTSITPHEMFERNKHRISYIAGQPNESFDSLVNKLVNGQFNCGSSSSTSNTSVATNGSSAGTTVVDEDATYQKALQEMSKSVRDLLSFEFKVPLNSPIFKHLHTNMMIWTELPEKFRLENLEEVFKILPTYKVNRGIKYMVNRWYVEDVKIKGDASGAFATIKVNPFPSDYSSYTNAVKGYVDAYNQAFRQQTTTTGGSNSSSGGVGQARLGNDRSETGTMACATGRYRGRAGDNENFDNCAKKGYAQEGKGYYNWARQYKTPLELAKALANRFSYSYYYNNQKSVDACHNNGGTISCNCYDACRLVKCCFDACGFDAVVITGSIYQGGHGWNAVKHNGRWYSFDLCYASTGREWAGTNSLRLCNEW